MPAEGQALTNKTSSRTGTLLKAAGKSAAAVKPDLLMYATMTGNDVILYRLNETFDEVKRHSGGINPLTI